MKIQKFSPLFNEKLIEDIFSSSILYEKNSFFVIEDQSYDENQTFHSFSEEVLFLKSAYEQGKSIIIKNLENFDEDISKRGHQLGRHTDIHLYLTPNEFSKSFPFHRDDRNVLVHILYGKKKFELKINGKVVSHELYPGDELNIPKGVEHRAIALGPSALLSFGYLENYYVPGGMNFEFIQKNHPIHP